MCVCMYVCLYVYVYTYSMCFQSWEIKMMWMDDQVRLTSNSCWPVRPPREPSSIPAITGVKVGTHIHILFRTYNVCMYVCNISILKLYVRKCLRVMLLSYHNCYWVRLPSPWARLPRSAPWRRTSSRSSSRSSSGRWTRPLVPYLSNALSATGGSVVVAADGLTTLRDSKVRGC